MDGAAEQECAQIRNRSCIGAAIPHDHGFLVCIPVQRKNFSLDTVDLLIAGQQQQRMNHHLVNYAVDSNGAHSRFHSRLEDSLCCPLLPKSNLAHRHCRLPWRPSKSWTTTFEPSNRPEYEPNELSEKIDPMFGSCCCVFINSRGFLSIAHHNQPNRNRDARPSRVPSLSVIQGRKVTSRMPGLEGLIPMRIVILPLEDLSLAPRGSRRILRSDY